MNYYSTREAAIIEGVTKTTASNWAKDHSYKKVGTQYLWTPENLLAFKSRRKQRGFDAGSRK